MPGPTPFLDALRLPAYVCAGCGFWQRYFERPAACPLCLDARHVVPSEGWRFLDLREAQAVWPTHWEELEPGAWRFWNEPVEGIGPSGYLLRNADGNVFFEGCTVFDELALARIRSLGGINVLSASHPHSYGALWQLQDRFDPELALPAHDFVWSAALRVNWPWDNTLDVMPGMALHRTAGHFDGHAVLHDRSRRLLLCGDALKFELDPTDRRRAMTISAHKAFVRGVPLTPSELRRYREVFAPLDFTATWTPFEQVRNSGRAEALALVDAQLSSRPDARQIPLSELSIVVDEGFGSSMQPPNHDVATAQQGVKEG